jgi:hypothetical protein
MGRTTWIAYFIFFGLSGPLYYYLLAMVNPWRTHVNQNLILSLMYRKGGYIDENIPVYVDR